MKEKNKVLLAILILILVFSSFFFFGVRVANDFPLISTASLLDRFNLPQTWTIGGGVGLGEYAVSTMWGWQVGFLYGLGAKLGLSFAVLERILGIIPAILIGVFSIRKLIKYLKIKNWFIPALFYLTTTYFLLLIDGGQFQIAIAYAWFPFAYLTVINSVKGNLSQRLLAGIEVSVLGFLDIRFVYTLAILLLMRFLYEFIFLKFSKWLSWVFAWIKSAAVIAVILLGLNAYWIVPSVFAGAPALPATYARATQTSFLSFANIGHAMFMLQPHWYKNVFGKIAPLLASFTLIPVLVFLAPILRKKDKDVGFWLLVSLVGIFLVKGSNPPLPGVYPWLFTHVPGFSIFRDPTKFYFLIVISYSLLIGITTDVLVRRFNWELKFRSWKLSIFPLLLTAYFILLIYPVYTSRMTGTFSQPYNKDEFISTNEKIKQDSNFGRIFYIPSRAPLGYASPTHPSVEASRLVNLRPFEIGTVGSYEQFNFLREASFMGQIFNIAGIKYIYYPYPDTRREELKQDNTDYYYAFLDQISHLPWISNELTHPPVSLLQTDGKSDHIFAAKNTFYIVGSDRIYSELMTLPGFDLSNNALIFAEEEPEQLKEIEDNKVVKIIAYDKRQPDVVASFFPKGRFIFPAKYLGFEPSTRLGASGWWKRETTDFLWFRNFIQEKYGNDYQEFDYGGGLAIAEGEKELTIKSDKLHAGDDLLVRMMNSSKGGTVSFYQEGEPLNGGFLTNGKCFNKINIKLTGYGNIEDQVFTYDCATLLWVDVGKLTKDGSITIKANGGINVINALVSISNEEYQDINRKLDGRIIYWKDLNTKTGSELFIDNNETNPTIDYERITPTHYKVRIESIEEPITVAFSESYDSMWELNGQPAYRLYSLINGFKVEKDGVYELTFSAQKYVLPGLVVSGFTLFGSFAVLYYLHRRKTS